MPFPPRLRKILLGTPMRVAVGLFALYLLAGFLVLPALARWQLERQVAAQLGTPLSIGALRFNPLTLRLEADKLKLADTAGGPLFELAQLRAQLEWRSLVDCAWTLSALTLDGPALHVVAGADGGYNFSGLLARLASGAPPAPDAAPAALPRLRVRSLALIGGRIDVDDRALTEPVLVRVRPLALQATNLSTLADAAAPFTLSLQSTNDERLQVQGTLALAPLAAQGTLSLKGLRLATLVRALSRPLDLAASTGRVDLALDFKFAQAADGALSAQLDNASFSAAELALRGAAEAEPRLTLAMLRLEGGRADLVQRTLTLGGVEIEDGRVMARSDAGGLDWARIVRPPVAPPTGSASAPAPAPVSAAAAAADAPPWRIAVQTLRVARVAFDYEAADGARRLQLDALGSEGSAQAEFGSTASRISLTTPSLTLAGARVDEGADGLDLPAAALQASRLIARVDGTRLAVDVEAPQLAAAQGLAARQGEGGPSARLRSAALEGRQLALQAEGGRFEMTLQAPKLILGALSLQRGDDGASADALDLQAASLLLLQSDGGLRLQGEAPVFTARTLALRQGDAQAALGRLAAKLAAFTLTQAGGRLQAQGRDAQLQLGALQARRAGERIALQDGTLSLKTFSAALGGSASAQTGSVRLDETAVELAAFGLTRGAGPAPLLRIAQARLGAGAIDLGLPAAGIELGGRGLHATLQDTQLRQPDGSAELLRLGRLELEGGSFGLRERTVRADRLALAGGRAALRLDAEGRLQGLALLDAPAAGAAGARALRAVPAAAARAAPASPAASASASASASAPAPAPAAAAASNADKPWRLMLQAGVVDDFEVDYEDSREAPPLALGLRALRVRSGALDTGAATPAATPVEFSARLASGGQVEGRGSVRADSTLAADLQLGASGLMLAPLQPYLAKVARLQLAGGSAGASGRLRYGGAAGAGARLSYTGSATVDGLRIDEPGNEQPLIGWSQVSTPDLELTLGPDRLDIGELLVDGPSGRLIIAPDQTVNLMSVLKKDPPPPGTAPAPPAAAAAAEADAAAVFPVSVARVKVAGGTLEFADLSLRPQFGTRMHDLRGVITGLGTGTGRNVQVELDAAVDDFGSARIRGQVSLPEPQQRTEIEMAFRNLDMRSLSPYVGKFAGYRVAGGRLSLDLNYRLQQRKLVGDNKIVLNKLELGEKVQSKDALDLPLELALAVLRDADGVIDIGLPVSGDLDDPSFDYGALIGKAIGNLLGGIVTAPFRALAALFGGGEKPLDSVEFEPGEALISPPERQQIALLAKALKARPGLTLQVPPTQAPALDEPVLRSRAARHAILDRMGIPLAADEDPGPVDSSNLRVQRAIEAVFSQRYAPAVLAVLKRRAIEALPLQAAASMPAPQAAASMPAPAAAAAAAAASASAAEPAAIEPGATVALRPPAAFYDGLVKRLIDEQPLPADALAQLAQRRAEAVVRELTADDGLPASRIEIGTPGATAAGAAARSDAVSGPASADGGPVTMKFALRASP